MVNVIYLALAISHLPFNNTVRWWNWQPCPPVSGVKVRDKRSILGGPQSFLVL